MGYPPEVRDGLVIPHFLPVSLFIQFSNTVIGMLRSDVQGDFRKIQIGSDSTGADGADGKPGADGADGKDGQTPVIGIKKDTDGKYYWTLNGAWLYDDNGNKIPTTGADGAPGADGSDGEDGADGAAGQPGAPGQDGQQRHQLQQIQTDAF